MAATRKSKQAVKEEVEVQEEQQVEVEDQEGEAQLEETEQITDDMYGEDGKELLFPGGPTLDKVEEWKSLFNNEVYLTEFDDDVFLWRPITRKEYKDVMKVQQSDSYYKEERICERVMVYPEGYNFMDMTRGKAGIPTLLSELIMEKSGFQAKTGALKL